MKMQVLKKVVLMGTFSSILIVGGANAQPKLTQADIPDPMHTSFTDTYEEVTETEGVFWSQKHSRLVCVTLISGSKNQKQVSNIMQFAPVGDSWTGTYYGDFTEYGLANYGMQSKEPETFDMIFEAAVGFMLRQGNCK